MQETWRWFGPDDPTSIRDIVQAGATGIVTALHHVPTGVVWSVDEIGRRQSETQLADGTGLPWVVVESLPVSEAIKTQSGPWRTHLRAWTQSLENLATAGVQVVCYNFMPVLDWTRTALAHPVECGATTMAFDLVDFAVFDLHILARAGAAADYADDIRAQAAKRADQMTDAAKAKLVRNVTAGLPGAEEYWTLDSLRAQLDRYAQISPERLRANLRAFLEAVVPVAERLGLRLCCHPDDPPWPLLGLPRIMSTEADYASLVAMVDSPANGITFCTGSLGARSDADLVGMVRRLGAHIHFAHLRNVRRADTQVPTSFFEDTHLDGSSDIVGIIRALLEEEAQRKGDGRHDHMIPMRPDHGQHILSDTHNGCPPGYPTVGRLRGLAELRGVAAALTWQADR